MPVMPVPALSLAEVHQRFRKLINEPAPETPLWRPTRKDVGLKDPPTLPPNLDEWPADSIVKHMTSYRNWVAVLAPHLVDMEHRLEVLHSHQSAVIGAVREALRGVRGVTETEKIIHANPEVVKLEEEILRESRKKRLYEAEAQRASKDLWMLSKALAVKIPLLAQENWPGEQPQGSGS